MRRTVLVALLAALFFSHLPTVAADNSPTSANGLTDGVSSGGYVEGTPTESVGWLSIGLLDLVVTVLVFLAFTGKRRVEPLDIPHLGPAPQVLEDGRPDPMGLPVITDDQGVMWRQHPDGKLDWWDADWQIWHGWEQ